MQQGGLSAKRSVLMAMSGGVDSTAAALKLLESGYTLIGCTFVTRYTSRAAIEAAQAIATQLGIEHHVIDYSDIFEQTIVDYFINEYKACRTPNPCILCNRLIKFGALVKQADKLGCDFIATGHYARIVRHSQSAVSNLQSFVAKGKDESKDQSYFLWQVDPEVLPRVLFPLGEMTKVEVRAYLASKGYEGLSKQGESQDICFITSDYRDFLRERLREEYKDYMSYTIGQRKGLGVALGYPAFVTKLTQKGYELGHHEDLYTTEIQLKNVLFRGEPDQPVMAKIRYRSAAVEAFIDANLQGEMTLHFKDSIWASTPGQSCVFYQNDRVVGGGIID